MNDAEMLGHIASYVGAILDEHWEGLETVGIDEVDLAEVSEDIYSAILIDLMSFARRDPAAKGDSRYVLQTYSPFRAVMHYRVANALVRLSNVLDSALAHSVLHFTARQISERAKADTQVEIHPSASIGRGFIIDHGIGTVIGETTVIGDDCYILQCVVLGATGVGDNPSGKRHPTLGNRVEIGAFSMVLGDISIGDDVFVEPHCVVTTSVPSNVTVKRVTDYQLIRKQEQFSVGNDAVTIYGVVPDGQHLHIFGSGLIGLGALLVDELYNPIAPLEVCSSPESNKLTVSLGATKLDSVKLKKAKLALLRNSDFACVVARASGLHDFLALASQQGALE